MPRWLMFTVFICVAMTIVGGVHFYLYRRLVVSPGLTGQWAPAARTLLVALAAILGRKKWGQRANRPRPTS